MVAEFLVTMQRATSQREIGVSIAGFLNMVNNQSSGFTGHSLLDTGLVFNVFLC
jgi:hypothetical protein